MRYIRDTERGVRLDEINRQCWAAVNASQQQQQQQPTEPAPTKVWDCFAGGWTTVIR